MTKRLFLSAALLALFSGHQAIAQDSAVINFTAELKPGGYSGTSALDPFVPGTPSYDLINGTGFFTAPASPDWRKFDGQIVISNFTGDGTYNIGGTGGDAGGIYFVSPLLNRIEAVSWRTEDALSPASLALGAGRRDGAATQNRDDIYLPDFTPNGVAAVTIMGDKVTIDYELDFSTLPDTNAAFLRNGVTPTQIGDILEANNSAFVSIGAEGMGMVTPVIESKGLDAAIPFGGYTALSEDVGGNLSNTIVPTTLELLANEIALNNISSDGRSLTNPDTVFLTLGDLAPFVGDTGDLYFYDLTGGGTLDASVATVVPIPAAAWLFASAIGLLAMRGRKRKS